MSDEGSPPLAGLPPDRHQRPEALSPSDPQGTVRCSASLSPYGVEDLTGEEMQRYHRSAALSPNDLRSPQSHYPSSMESLTYPETPAFRLASERATEEMSHLASDSSTNEKEQLASEPSVDENDPIEDTSLILRKRKRSPAPASRLDSEPSLDEKDQIEGTSTKSRKRKRSQAPVLDVLPLTRLKHAGGEKLCRFQGVIGHRRYQEARRFAKKMENSVMRTDTIHRHIFWTDASIVFRACAAGAVAWKQSPTWTWQTEGFPYPYCVQSTEVVEMFAIAHALKRAVDEVKASLGDRLEGLGLPITHQVFIFTDSVGALTQVENDAWGHHTPITCEQAHTIIDFSIELHNLGAKLELHLVPGHKGVSGNNTAHRAAYKAATRAAAAAGIQSNEQGVLWHETQGGVALIDPATTSLVPASPVPIRCPRSSGTNRTSLSRPLLSQPIKPSTAPVLIPPENSDAPPRTEEMISLFFSEAQFVRPDRTPDRTPETTPAPGPSLTSTNAGSTSVTGFNPVNAIFTLSTGSSATEKTAPKPVTSSDSNQARPYVASIETHQEDKDSPALAAKVSSAQSAPVTPAVFSSFYWFTPISAKPVFLTERSSRSPSMSTQKPALAKGQEIEPAGTEYLRSPRGSPFSPEPLCSSPRREPTSTDDAKSSLHSGRFSFTPTNKILAAVLNPSAVSKSYLEPATPANAPGSAPSTLNPVIGFMPKDNRQPVFGGTAFSVPTLQIDGAILAPAPSFATTSKLRSFASPTEPSDGLTLAPISSFPQSKPKRLPPLPPSGPGIFNISSSVLTTSKMRSFASPGEPGDELTLAPPLSFDEGETKHCGDTSLTSLPSVIPDMPKASTAIVKASNMRIFDSPGEPRAALTLAPISNFCQSEPKYPDDMTLSLLRPSRPPDIRSTFTSIVKTSKMRLFASPVEPMDGLTLTSISSFPQSEPTHPEDATLPTFRPSRRGIFDASNFIVKTAKMRSFASPQEPVDGLTLAPISSIHDDWGAAQASVPRWPSLFTGVQTNSPDTARSPSTEPSSDASASTASSSFTLTNAGTTPQERTDLPPAVPFNRFAGVYTTDPQFPTRSPQPLRRCFDSILTRMC